MARKEKIEILSKASGLLDKRRKLNDKLKELTSIDGIDNISLYGKEFHKGGFNVTLHDKDLCNIVKSTVVAHLRNEVEKIEKDIDKIEV